MSKKQILAGFHAVNARLRSQAASIDILYTDAARHDSRLQTLVQRAASLNVAISSVDAQHLDALSQGQRHQGVVAQAAALQLAQSIDEVINMGFARQSQGGAAPFLLLLDGVTDPHNLGACMRTAEACGVDAIIAPKDRSAGLSATSLRVACGAADSLPYLTVTNLARTLRALHEDGLEIFGTDDQANQSIYETELIGPTAWVMGAEGEGMRRLTKECCTHLVNIPMQGVVESLNVSVAAGVCLFETVRQRRLQI